MNKIIKINAKCSYAYFNRGNIKCKMRNFKEAISDYSMAIALNPELAEAYYNRALILIFLNDTSNAYSDLSVAGELGLKKHIILLKDIAIKKYNK